MRAELARGKNREASASSSVAISSHPFRMENRFSKITFSASISSQNPSRKKRNKNAQRNLLPSCQLTSPSFPPPSPPGSPSLSPLPQQPPHPRVLPSFLRSRSRSLLEAPSTQAQSCVVCHVWKLDQGRRQVSSLSLSSHLG